MITEGFLCYTTPKLGLLFPEMWLHYKGSLFWAKIRSLISRWKQKKRRSLNKQKDLEGWCALYVTYFSGSYLFYMSFYCFCCELSPLQKHRQRKSTNYSLTFRTFFYKSLINLRKTRRLVWLFHSSALMRWRSNEAGGGVFTEIIFVGMPFCVPTWTLSLIQYLN